MSTETTLNHHLDALARGDLDGVMNDYTEASVVITPDGPLRGLDEIRKLFNKIVKDMLPPGSEFEMLRKDVEGEVAYTVWRGASARFNFLIGTDTFIVRSDKIVCQTFAAQIQQTGAFKTVPPPES